MADYRKSLLELTPEEREEVAPGFAPAEDVSKPISVQGAELAVSTLTPLDFAVDVQQELRKEKPDYLKIGMLAGVEVIGALPGLGGAAKNMIRKGAKFRKKPDVVDAESNIPSVPKSRPEEFSGTIKVQHGYQGEAPKEFLPRGQYDGFRYDTDGGNFGDKPLYLEDPDNPFFLNEDRVVEFVKDGVVDVDASFDKAFVLTPETVDTLKSKVGDVDLLDETSGPLVVDKLEELGYDGLIIRGFPHPYDTELTAIQKEMDEALRGLKNTPEDFARGQEIVESYQSRMRAAEEKAGLVEDMQQPQILAFRPERQKVRLDREADVLQAERLLDEPEALKAWQEQNKLPETQRQSNPEQAQAAADALFEGEITSKEARQRVRDAIPDPQLYEADQVMEMMPTVTEVTGSLGKKAGKFGILGVKGFDLESGQQVSSRLDIPAYNNYDTWVVSIHDGTKDAGSVVGFGQAIRLKGIRFGSKSKEALSIARGKRTTAAGEDKPMGKSTIARIFGEYEPEDPYELQRQAADIIASGSEEWTQVGMNPYRGSAFYDKKTGMPVFEADEVIQVGPLVLAKNVKKPTISQMKEMAVKTRDGKTRMFNEGGAVMDEQMNAVFKSSRGMAAGGSVDLDTVPDNTIGIDPVSGNEIPLGSTPENVRDDIPAQLSEGEYVVPADVVRYYGVKFFEDLRAEAKFGYQDMQENGRIGGDPVGMEMGGDELPFDISELQVVDEPVEMAEGGMAPIAYGGTMYGGGGVEYIEYTDGTRTMLIPFFNGVPMAVIPEGFYAGSPNTAAEEAAATPSSSDDGGPDIETPEPIDYANLTTDELAEMVEQQTTFGMDDGAAAFLGALNPLAGLFMKGAMMHQAKLTKKELERRVAQEDITDEERTRLQSLIEVTEQPNFMQGILGKIKGAFEPEKKEPPLPTIDKQSVTDAVTEAMMYDPTAKSALEDSTITTSELAPIVTPTNKAGEMPEPYRATVDGPNVAAMRKTYLGDENTQPDVDFSDPTMVPDAAPEPNETENMRMRRAGERAGDYTSASEKSRAIRRASEKRGKSIAEIGRAIAPSDEDRSPDYSDPRRGGAPTPTTRRRGSGGGGRNKGGLASKKKK